MQKIMFKGTIIFLGLLFFVSKLLVSVSQVGFKWNYNVDFKHKKMIPCKIDASFYVQKKAQLYFTTLSILQVSFSRDTRIL